MNYSDNSENYLQLKSKRRALAMAVSGALFYGTTLGIIGYTVGNFFLPISRELECGIGSVALYSTFQGISVAATMPLSRILTQKNMRTSLTSGAALIVLSLYGFSRIHTLFQFYLCAISIGIGLGFFNGATIPTFINKWFHKKNGSVLGASLSFGAITGAIFNPVLSRIIQTQGWRTAYIVLAVMAALFMLPCALFVVSPDPESEGLLPYGYDPEEKSVTAAAEEIKGATFRQAVRHPAFYALMLSVPCIAFIFYLTSHLPTYGVSIGLSATLGSLLTSASLIGGMSGKLSLGVIADKFGAKATMSTAMISVAAGVSLVALGSVYPPLLIPGTLLYGYGSCGTALFPALLTKSVFGDRDYNAILTAFSICSSFLGSFGSSVYGLLFDKTGTYMSGFILSIVLACIVLILSRYAIGKGKYLSKM